MVLINEKLNKMFIPWNKGKKLHYTIWNKGKKGYHIKDTRITKICITCLGEFKVYPSIVNKRFSCSKKCVPTHEAWNKGIKGYLSGENHYKWKKDRTTLSKRQERNDMAYKEWRKEVHKRDNWKCRIINKDCKGRIEVHHILGWTEYPELRYQINNGITLCHAHHPRKREDEAKLSPFFQSLVAEM